MEKYPHPVDTTWITYKVTMEGEIDIYG